jgi:CRP/FNR family transcriptional regulator
MRNLIKNLTAKKDLPEVRSIREVSFFDGLSWIDLELVQKCLRERTLKKGDIIFSQGDRCRQVFFVRSGQIKICRNSRAGRQQIVEVLNPGQTCACHPGSCEWCCAATAISMKSGRIWFVSTKDFNRLMNSSPNLAFKLNMLFAEKIRDINHLMEGFSLQDARERLVRFILEQRKAGQVGSQNDDVVNIAFTREEIAHCIGTTRETAIRYLYELKSKRLIDIRNHQIILRDVEGLANILERC